MAALLTKEALAEQLGVRVQTLYRWTKRPGFPQQIRIGPNCVRWSRDEIDAYLRACPRGPGRSAPKRQDNEVCE